MTCKLLFALLLGCSSPSHANDLQGCVGASDVQRLLELDERTASAAACDLATLAKPVPGPRGTRGKWTLPGATLAGLPLTTTLFVGQGRIKRIEQTWASNDAGCTQSPEVSAISRALTVKFGTPSASNVSTDDATTEETLSWVADDTAIASFLVRTPMSCSVRLVLQRLQLRDASEL